MHKNKITTEQHDRAGRGHFSCNNNNNKIVNHTGIQNAQPIHQPIFYPCERRGMYRVRTYIAEVARPAVKTDPAAVLGALVVAEFVATGVARQRTTTSVVAGVAEQTIGQPR